jgi:hypothetical protein
MNAVNTGIVVPQPFAVQRPRTVILSIVAGLILVAVLFLAFYKKTIGPFVQDGWDRLTSFFRNDGTAKVAIGPGETPILTATLNPEPTVMLPPLTQPLFPERNLADTAASVVPPVTPEVGSGPSAQAVFPTESTVTQEPVLEFDDEVKLPEPVYVPKPGDTPPGDKIGVSPEDRPSGMPGSVDPTLGTLPSQKLADGKEVFTIANNVYTFNDAAAVCAAAGAELASYDQVKAAYEHGAEWCNYGWIKGQMAVYPTQKESWDSLQKGPSEFRNACGRPGINGGYFDNPDLRFGVTCYGAKPQRKPGDALLESQVALPQSAEEIEFQKNVQKFRDQLDSATVLPFHKGQWSQ